MRRLPPIVRLKAIEIANALLEEGMDEGMAIRIAFAKAKEWALRHHGDRGRAFSSVQPRFFWPDWVVLSRDGGDTLHQDA